MWPEPQCILQESVDLLFHHSNTILSILTSMPARTRSEPRLYLFLTLYI